MAIRFEAISGVGAKGPACFLFEIGGSRILVDAGIGPDAGRVPDLSRVGHLDAVVISHAHPDHAGALSLLGCLAPDRIHATRTTLELLGFNGGVELPERGETIIAGLRIATGRAGHCAGGVWLRFEEGGGFLYMGDHCEESAIYDYDEPPASSTVVVDASYGSYQERNGDSDDWVARIAGLMPVVLPVPADGRGLEILAMLADAGIGPLCTDGPVRASLERCLHLDDGYLRPGTRERLLLMATNLKPADPANLHGVAVVSNGEANGGMAAEFVAYYETTDKPSFIFTGYTGAGTASARLVASGRAQKRRWNVHPTFGENVELVRRIGARTVVPAFLDSDDYARCASAFLPAVVTHDRTLVIP
jgi:Cft2 family RNA processing exonuclease